MLVLGCGRELEIGKTYRGMTDGNNEMHPDMPFHVIRESNYEEWIAQPENKEVTARELEDVKRGCVKFYLVSVD